MLFQLGTLTFEVAPVSLHGMERDGQADYAAKDVIGTLRPREYVGEGDSKVTIRGRIFPEKFGGIGAMDALEAMRVSGTPQILIRGDFTNLGWWLIDSYSQKDSHHNRSGVPRMIEFDVKLVKAGAPSAAAYVPTLLSLINPVAGVGGALATAARSLGGLFR